MHKAKDFKPYLEWLGGKRFVEKKEQESRFKSAELCRAYQINYASAEQKSIKHQHLPPSASHLSFFIFTSLFCNFHYYIAAATVDK